MKVFCQISQWTVILMISTRASPFSMFNLYVKVTVDNYMAIDKISYLFFVSTCIELYSADNVDSA